MEISYDKFIEILTAKALHDIRVHALPRAHKIVLQQYCRKLSLRSACSGECDTCILKVKDKVDWINGLIDQPNQPYGFYTLMVKHAFAQKVEEMAKKPVAKPDTNALGERTDKDAFDLFLETLS